MSRILSAILLSFAITLSLLIPVSAEGPKPTPTLTTNTIPASKVKPFVRLHPHSIVNSGWNWVDYTIELAYDFVDNGGALLYGDYAWGSQLSTAPGQGEAFSQYFAGFVGGNTFTYSYTEIGVESQYLAGPQWYVFSKNGVTCVRGTISRAGNQCTGAVGDLALNQIGVTYTELACEPIPGLPACLWTVFVQPPNQNTRYEVATINTTVEAIYNPELTVEEAYDPVMYINGNPWPTIHYTAFRDPSWALVPESTLNPWWNSNQLSQNWVPNTAFVSASPQGNPTGCPNIYVFTGMGFVNADPHQWTITSAQYTGTSDPQYMFCSGNPF